MFTGLKWQYEVILVFLISAGGLYGWHKVAEAYRQQGRVEISQKWDAQKTVDAQAKAQEIQDARKAERADADAKAKIDKQLLEEQKHENAELNNRLAAYRNDNRKLRTITGQAITGPQNGTGNTQPGTGGSNATCTVRLPPEIGEAFQRLREEALRVGSEANNTGLQANAAAKVIEQDRLTCNQIKKH